MNEVPGQYLPMFSTYELIGAARHNNGGKKYLPMFSTYGLIGAARHNNGGKKYLTSNV